MTSRIASGALSPALADLLAVALVLSFGLLWTRRVTGMISLYGLQGGVLAAAAAWQGYVQASPRLYLVAVIALAAKAVLIPVALRRIVRRLDTRRAAETALGAFPPMALGVGLVVLSNIVAREDLAVALSVLLLGLLTMTTRKTAIPQVLGFLGMENGVSLAEIGAPGLPMAVELSVAALAVLALMLFAAHIGEQSDVAGARHTDRVGGERH